MRTLWLLLAAAGLWLSVANAEPVVYPDIMTALTEGRCHDANLLLIRHSDALTDDELAAVARAATAQQRYCRRLGRAAQGSAVVLTAASFVMLPLPWIAAGIAATNAVAINAYLIWGYRKNSAVGCSHEVAMARLRRGQRYDDR